jgi:hypothetical protein
MAPTNNATRRSPPRARAHHARHDAARIHRRRHPPTHPHTPHTRPHARPQRRSSARAPAQALTAHHHPSIHPSTRTTRTRDAHPDTRPHAHRTSTRTPPSHTPAHRTRTMVDSRRLTRARQRDASGRVARRCRRRPTSSEACPYVRMSCIPYYGKQYTIFMCVYTQTPHPRNVYHFFQYIYITHTPTQNITRLSPSPGRRALFFASVRLPGPTARLSSAHRSTTT